MGISCDNHRVSARELKWLHRAFWSLCGLVGILGLLVMAWLSVSTGNFLMVIEYRYHPETASFEVRRKVNWPWDIEAEWETDAHGNGLECTYHEMRLHERYETDRNGKVVIGPDGRPMEKIAVFSPAPAALLPCLTDPNASVVSKWSFRVLGPIYLRPTYRYIPPR